jgi:hypothetical protein
MQEEAPSIISDFFKTDLPYRIDLCWEGCAHPSIGMKTSF